LAARALGSNRLRQRAKQPSGITPPGAAEEAPAAYKDIEEVAEATEHAGLARRVAELRPLVCIKG
jgi:RNA-splicing ligase RtcB